MTEQRRCIFYRPYPLDQNSRSGSGMRPAAMLQAFRQLGYHVDVFAGRAVERKRIAREVRKRLAAGVHYDFLYAEPPSTPTLLTEPHHFPTHPFVDYGLLLACRSRHVPVLLFYRDVHWRLPEYRRTVGWLKYLVLLPFLHLDLLAYRRLTDALLVPDARMLPRIARWALTKPNWTAVPGFDSSETLPARDDTGSPPRLFYVGGVEPPVYDLNPLLLGSAEAIAAGVPHTLTICARKPEWIRGGPLYSALLGPHVRIVHNNTREELLDLYASHDISVMPFGTLNSDWAMPIKFPEALGMGLPVLAGAGTAVGDIVERERIGWLVDGSTANFVGVLRGIDAPELARARAAVAQIRLQYSWVERARQVAAIAETFSRPESDRVPGLV
jgi:glycosyltransferase involved in cell wall biosynthesis